MMKYKKPKQGETVHCWSDGKNYRAHYHMLFLGKDKHADDKLLVQSHQHGWDIIRLSELPEGKYRPLGRFNIVEEFVNKKEFVTGYTYRFFDNRKPVDITVKVVRGVWRIKNDFKTPSWVKKEETEEADAGGS